MSDIKNNFSSDVLTKKIIDLYESIDKGNSARLLVDRYISQITSTQVYEGNLSPDVAYSQLRGFGIPETQAKNSATSVQLNENAGRVSDSALIWRLSLLENFIKDLKVYDWLSPISSFIEESNKSLRENEISILLERIIYDLENSKNVSYYKNAILKLVEARESSNPVFFIVNEMETEKWIPLINQLFEYCQKIKGSVSGSNPNFTVSKIYSPIEFIEESEDFTFFSKVPIRVNEGKLEVVDFEGTSTKFKNLSKLVESSKISENTIKIYPNHKNLVELKFNESGVNVKLNGSVVESENLNSALDSNGLTRYTDQSVKSMINFAIEEGNSISEIDFGYRVKSNIYEGLMVNVFELNDNIYIQKINESMMLNDLILAESAEDAVDIVKDFMNYDISESISHLLESEKADEIYRESEIEKIQNRINFLNESKENLIRKSKLIGVEGSGKIKSAIEFLDEEILEQTKNLSNISSELIVENRGISEDNETLNETINESEAISEASKSEIEEAIANVESKLRQYRSKHPNTMHPFDPQKKMKDYVKYLESSLANLKASLSNVSESTDSSVNESHFKVGDKVKCKDSGNYGEIVKLDKPKGEDDEKYYSVKTDDGEIIKYAPKDLKIKETTLNESRIKDPTKVKKGDKAEAYNGEVNTVIDIVQAKDWKKVNKYDDSGWMDGSDFEDIIDFKEDYLIAVKSPDGENIVYVYGGDGAAVYESESVNESKCQPGKDYIIDGVVYTYEGFVGDLHIFNSKDLDEKSALNLTSEDLTKYEDSGKIKEA